MTAILISGMHRSGTSALARVVSLLGARLPETLVPAREDDNPSGFWEGARIVRTNEEYLRRSHSWWGGWQLMCDPAGGAPPDVVAEARQIIEQEFEHAPLIVVKDPRLSRLLPAWTAAVEAEGYNAVHVIALRHPQQVASSLASRNGLSSDFASISWLAHMLDSEFYSRGGPRVVVEYGELIRSWPDQLARVAAAVGAEWPVAFEEANEKVERFLDPSLQHWKSSNPLSGGADVEVYEVLKRWAQDQPEPDDLARLDEWRRMLSGIRRFPSPTVVVRQRFEDDWREFVQSPTEVDITDQRLWGNAERQAFDEEAHTAMALFRACEEQRSESDQLLAELDELRSATRSTIIDLSREARERIDALRRRLQRGPGLGDS